MFWCSGLTRHQIRGQTFLLVFIYAQSSWILIVTRDTETRNRGGADLKLTRQTGFACIYDLLFPTRPSCVFLVCVWPGKTTPPPSPSSFLRWPPHALRSPCFSQCAVWRLPKRHLPCQAWGSIDWQAPMPTPSEPQQILPNKTKRIWTMANHSSHLQKNNKTNTMN